MVYHIIREDGSELGLTDNVVYIQKNEHGGYTPATEAEAIGIAYMGVPYNLDTNDEIEGAEHVHIVKDETSSIISDMVSYSELAAAIREGVNQVG
jgi:hypothetical protein